MAAQIQLKDISETNRLPYATAVVVAERLGIKLGKNATKEPWWKRELQGQVDQLHQTANEGKHGVLENTTNSIW